jgi:hypothetical protein
MSGRVFIIGLGAAALTAATLPASAAPIPAATAAGIAGQAPIVDVQYRRYPRRGVRYYRRDRTGAAVAGAALGIIGGIAAAQAYNNGYYGHPAYGYPAYPAYPAYGYGYDPY